MKVDFFNITPKNMSYNKSMSSNSSKIKKFFLIFFVILASVCEGQPSITWTRLYDSPYQMDDYAYKVIHADSGNFYIIGRVTKPTWPYYGVANILKIDPYGKPIWHSILDSVFQFPNSRALTPDGGCVTVGSGGSRFLKIDREGAFVWFKSYNTMPVQLWDVIRTPDSGYIACGYVNSIQKDGYVIKIDSAGNFQWDRRFPATDWIILNSIINGIDSNYVIAGFTTVPSVRAILYELGNDGSQLNLKTYKVQTGFTQGIAIKKFNQGYLLGALTAGPNYLIFLNKNFDSTKTLMFPATSNKMTYLSDICVINENKIAIASEIIDGFTSNYSNIMISDTLGNILNNKNFYPGDSSGFVKLMSIIPLSNGGVLSAGYTDYNGFDNNDNYIAIRTDSLLNAPPVGISVHDEFVPENFTLYQNYPNPFNPTTTISYNLPKAGLVNITVYDIAGKEVAKLVNEFKAAGSYDITFTASNLSSGIYFYSLSADRFTDTKKMVVIK